MINLYRIAARITNQTAMALNKMYTYDPEKELLYEVPADVKEPYTRFFEFIEVPVNIFSLPTRGSKAYREKLAEQAKEKKQEDAVNLLFYSVADSTPEWLAHDYWHANFDPGVKSNVKFPENMYGRLNDAFKSDFGQSWIDLKENSSLMQPTNLIPYLIQNKEYKSSMAAVAAEARGETSALLDTAADLGITYFIDKGVRKPFKLKYDNDLYTDDESVTTHKQEGYRLLTCDKPDLPKTNVVFNQIMDEIYASISDAFESYKGKWLYAGPKTGEL